MLFTTDTLYILTTAKKGANPSCYNIIRLRPKLTPI